MNDTVEATRSLVLLNNFGDTTISWDKDSDDDIIPIIQQKMDEGIVFFILEKPRLVHLFKDREQIRLTNIEQAQKSRRVVMMDRDFAELMEKGLVQTNRNNGGTNIDTVGISRDAKEVATSHSVGVKPMVGG